MSARARAQMALEIVEYRQKRSEWDQSLYWDPEASTECGTAGCLAGWLVHAKSMQVVTKGYGTDYASIAMKLLDIDWFTASRLFSGANSLQDLRDYICMILSGEEGRVVDAYAAKWLGTNASMDERHSH